MTEKKVVKMKRQSGDILSDADGTWEYIL